MSVYKRNYRPYSGKITPLSTRILVLARYGLSEAWFSKVTVGLVMLCFISLLIFLFGIYLANNPIARLLILKRSPAINVDAGFFLKMLTTQSWLVLVLSSWIAPRLVTFDLADNALPILLSHPISRFGYVFGKFLALFASLSVVTWIPCLMLFAYQGYASPQPWFLANLSLAGGLFVGALLWVAFLSLLGLALSSWVKWRIVATGAIFAAVLVPAGVGAIATVVLRTRWGLLLNLPAMMSFLWQRLLGAPAVGEKFSLPTASILAMLFAASLLFVAMLNARIRAHGVVKG